MLVYDDTTTEHDVESVRRELLQSARCAGADVDTLRSLLISAGRLEQAVEDSDVCAAPPFRTATSAFARAFLAVWSDGPGSASQSALRDAVLALESAAGTSRMLGFKIPEGFAYYALFPEQYALAARRWAATRPVASTLLIGIRSIGTTLSAVVAEELAGLGWPVQRLTVRPGGHPFTRSVQLPDLSTYRPRWAIVVDEGPGISGSSMSAVVSALRRSGFERECIALLPGHGNGPGAAARAETRAIWAETSSYAASDEEAFCNGEDLASALSRATRATSDSQTDVAKIDDLGSGAWRNFVYARREQWPAIAAPLERAKYRVVLADGTAVLWKFAGLQDALGSETAGYRVVRSILDRRAALGWTPAPLAAVSGFVAVPWIEGEPLNRMRASGAVAEQIGRYIADVTGPPLDESTYDASFGRLCAVLDANLTEALSPDAAGIARKAMSAVRDSGPMCAAGDGRLAPHEWRSCDGQLLKLNATPHAHDHTIIGCQPVAWDLAAALTEWQFHGRRAKDLLHGYTGAGGAHISSAVLTAYRLAYSAYRMGECTFFAQFGAGDPAERERLSSASRRYQRACFQILKRLS